MDDDSQDELINRNAAAHGSGGRSRGQVVSEADDSSDAGPSGDSEEDTGSEEDGDAGGEEGEEGSDWNSSEDDDSVDDQEVEVSLEAALEPPKGRPDLPARGSSSSDEDTESCPICLNVFRDQVVGTPENCTHYFCLDCIVEWSKNANSCPVDRILFKWICIRARFGGKVLKKIPVESQKAPRAQEDEEDPTFCEVCGRSDREDRLLLCDGCDAGYHMECLNPSLSEVPVDEWFCPECIATAAPAVPPAAATDAEPVSEEEVALLLVDVVPTTSRLRPNAGRTRAIARTRQSERVRATVNRNRISTAQRIQRVPRYLMSSLLDETIEAVASGLSTAVYHRPLTPRAPVRRKRRTGRRKKASGRKRASSRSSARSKTLGTRPKRRKSRAKKRRGQRSRVKTEITARSRIARTLGLGKPLHGASIPSVYKPVEPSLGFMRADIGAASLSLFGDPYELDPYDSEELPANQASPLSTKRRILSQSALRSHQPVARPISLGLSRRSVPASVPEQDVEVAPVPDLVGSILSGQNLLMMSSSDVVINRDGSLTARKAAPISLQRTSAAKSQEDGEARSRDSIQPRTLQSGTSASHLSSDVSEHLGLNSCGGAATSILSVSSSSCLRGLEKSMSPSSSVPRKAAVKLEYSMTPRPVQTQNLANRSKLGLKPNEMPQLNGENKRPVSVTTESPKVLRRTAIGLPLPPAPRRIDISELPRIPKMKREGGSGSDGHVDSKPACGKGTDIPSSCINRLTGREGSSQPARGGRVESKPSGRDSQEPKMHSGGSGGGGSCTSTGGPGSHSSLAPFGPSRGKGLGSSFESFRINIPGNTANPSRLPNPGFCNTFRPVDNKVQRKENPSPLFSIKKTKQIKSEIYDPFDPTGSDSSSPSSSPERLGAGLLPSEITRTISVDSPKVPTFQTVRCVTSYTVENVFGSGSDPSDGPSSSHPERISTGTSDLEKMEEEEEDEEEPGNSPCVSTTVRRHLSERAPLEADGREHRSTFFATEERTVTCVTLKPASPSEEEVGEEEEVAQPAATTHRIVEIHSPSRSRSNSSSRSRKKARRKKMSTKEHKKTRSRSRSLSHSRERSSRSTSRSVEEDHAKKHRFKAKPRRSSSDRSGSHDRAKKKRAKEKRKGPWSRDRQKSRSRSGSPGSSSYEVCESRKKRRRRSSSRGRGREGSHSSSPERARRHKHRRQKSFERYEKKERSSRPRDRRSSRSRSRERRKWRSRSPSASRSREHKRARSREKRPHSRSRSRDGKPPGKDVSPSPLQEKEAKAAEESTPSKLPAPGQAGPSQVDGPQALPAIEETMPEAPAQPEVPEEVAADDLDYGETVEAEHVFDDFSSDAVFIQLDDMSSPPSPESTDSSPERGLLLPLALPAGSGQCSLSLGVVAAAKCEAPPEPPAASEGPPGEAPSSQGAPENQVGEVTTVEGEEGPVVSEEVSEAVESEMEVISQIPLLKSKALVKRVTWNLQEEEDSMAGPEPEPRAPFYKLPRSLEGAWKAEDSNPSLNQVQSREPPPTNYMVAEPMFPDLGCSQVYSPNMPLTQTLPPSVPPYAPVSQPTVQFIMQGSLPLVGCGTGQSLTPEPAVLATVSEPGGPAPAAGDGDEKTTPKQAGEKTKNEEYMKKLHVQERAVEEVKLAIKPFYQKREITKDEYKDILRKAVQKICHSKSGEINPMKVANLVKAYVEKYKHMRKHKKTTEAEEEPHEAEN
ncbi:PHD and RING finger domain-containing protein 1 isoform X2 [Phascolarctos cinereus]|uniref:PHD and RING finger domain-containing protein 1 isoform X2 n=1 Tax=Phascolarctos cinereus TaxID=38626 RepID=A0A6P5JVH4_PHACI|nr:PHD and RING finger domain-containing protein 1 isoform X2 [Phascolarctos cinereus]